VSLPSWFKERREHSLDRKAVRVHAGDYDPEALGAWRESRHIRTLRITALPAP
jgi:hypothetical protein